MRARKATTSRAGRTDPLAGRIRSADSGPYSASFFEGHRVGAHAAAETIIPRLLEFAEIHSVLDVGCGVGTWLRVFAEHGVSDALGIDFADVEPTSLEIEPSQFLRTDLTLPCDLGRRFDLAVCLEVAEHLPHDGAATLVQTLSTHADTILFSAAAPGQGGMNHVNERWPSYWANLFGDAGFLVRDVFRRQLWELEELPFWYRQNLLLFVRGASATLLGGEVSDSVTMLDIAHPVMVELMLRRRMTLRRIANDFLPAIRASFRYHILGKPE